MNSGFLDYCNEFIQIILSLVVTPTDVRMDALSVSAATPENSRMEFALIFGNVREVLQKNRAPAIFCRAHGFMFSEVASNDYVLVSVLAIAMASASIAIGFEFKHRE